MKLLEEINELLEEEHAESIEAEQAISSSGVDSFGLTMLLMTIGEKFKLWQEDRAFGEIDFENITPNDIQRLINESK